MEEASYTPVKINLLGVFGHGCGHLNVAVNGLGVKRHLPPYQQDVLTAPGLAILFFFWCTLTLASRESVGAVGHLVLAVVFYTIHLFFVPDMYAFSYVQTMLILLACCM